MCSPAWAAIALVTNTKVAGNGTTPAINTTGANLLTIKMVEFGASPPAPTDSLSNTWTKCGAEAISGNSHAQIYYAKNATVGAAQTFTVAGGSFPSLFAASWSGVDTSAPCDQTGTGTVTGGQDTVLSSVTPSQNNELIITVLSNNSSDNPTVDSGFTKQDTQLSTSNEGVAWAYLIQGTAAAVAPTWHTAGSSNQAACIATFKAAAAGGAGGASVGGTAKVGGTGKIG
jgi:hypothetical protein